MHLTGKAVGVAFSKVRKIIGTDAKILYGIIDIISRRESEKHGKMQELYKSAESLV